MDGEDVVISFEAYVDEMVKIAAMPGLPPTLKEQVIRKAKNWAIATQFQAGGSGLRARAAFPLAYKGPPASVKRGRRLMSPEVWRGQLKARATRQAGLAKHYSTPEGKALLSKQTAAEKAGRVRRRAQSFKTPALTNKYDRAYTERVTKRLGVSPDASDAQLRAASKKHFLDSLPPKERAKLMKLDAKHQLRKAKERKQALRDAMGGSA